MIYAYRDGDTTTIVAAAASVAALDDFYARAVADRNFKSERQPEFMELLTNPVFAKLKKPPIIFEHLTADEADAFAQTYKIEILGPNAVIAKAEDMIRTHEFVTASATGEADTRTIGEVLGLDKDDPWDKRSEEAKAEAEQYKKDYDKAKKQGVLSGESFAGPAGKVARVTDINTIQQSGGGVIITDVRAAKAGRGKDEVHPAYAMEEEVRIRRDYAVNPQDYYRADAATEPQSKRPRDYNFCVVTADGGETLLALTPRRTFAFSKLMEDKPLAPIFGGSFPFAVEETENGLFTASATPDEAREAAEKLGFVFAKAFQDVVKPPTVEELLAEEAERQEKDRAEHPDHYTVVLGRGNVSQHPDDYAFGVTTDGDNDRVIEVVLAERRRFEITRTYDDLDTAKALRDVLPNGLGRVSPGVFNFDRGLLEDEIRKERTAALNKAIEAAAAAGVEIKQPEEKELTEEEKVSLHKKMAVKILDKAGYIHHAGIQNILNAAEAKRLKAAEAEAEGETEEAAGPTTLADLKTALTKPRHKAKGATPEGVIGEEHLLNDKPEDQGPAENFDDNGDNIAVANDGMVGIYFKVEVTSGQKLAEVVPALEEAGFPIRAAFVQRDHTAGCWFAFTRAASATEMAEILKGLAGYEVKDYAIDQSGEALIETTEAGVTVVDTEALEAEIPIRPWNSRKAEYEALTDDEKKANRKEWKGGEFILTCEYKRETGCTVLIQPKSYFYEDPHEPKLYPEHLDISHILPEDLKHTGDNWYNTMSRDENRLMVDLCVKRKFIDDWMLRLYLNQQDY